MDIEVCSIDLKEEEDKPRKRKQRKNLLLNAAGDLLLVSWGALVYEDIGLCGYETGLTARRIQPVHP
jgi:predicted nucleic acid-binding Zn ribbon protein